MAKRRKKRLPLPLAIVVIVFAVLWVVFGDRFGGARQVDVVDGTIELYILDVGQGDAILIKAEEGNILIDTGDTDTKEQLKNDLVQLGVSEIEYAVFTHPDSDHIGGAETVLKNFKIKNVIMPELDEGDIPTTNVYKRMIEALENDENINVMAAQSGDGYNVGDVKLKLLAPNSDNYTNRNDYSVVTRVDFGSTSFLLTGDMETKSEKEILDIYPASELKCTFFKAAHHGSSTSNTQAMLDAVRPEVIAISCGEGNDYGHPHREAMERFEQSGADIYRTDVEGTLKFISDGTTVTKAE